MREAIIEPLISRIPTNIQLFPLFCRVSQPKSMPACNFVGMGVLHFTLILLIRFTNRPYWFYEKLYNSLLDEAKLLRNRI